VIYTGNYCFKLFRKMLSPSYVVDFLPHPVLYSRTDFYQQPLRITIVCSAHQSVEVRRFYSLIFVFCVAYKAKFRCTTWNWTFVSFSV